MGNVWTCIEIYGNIWKYDDFEVEKDDGSMKDDEFVKDDDFDGKKPENPLELGVEL